MKRPGGSRPFSVVPPALASGALPAGDAAGRTEPPAPRGSRPMPASSGGAAAILLAGAAAPDRFRHPRFRGDARQQFLQIGGAAVRACRLLAADDQGLEF